MQLAVPVVQVEGNLLKSEYFRADNIMIVNPCIIVAGNCSDFFRLRTCYQANVVFQDFSFWLGNNILLPPPLFMNGSSTLDPSAVKALPKERSPLPSQKILVLLMRAAKMGRLGPNNG